MMKRPRAIRPILAACLLFAILGMGTRASAADALAPHEAEGTDWRWALTQGGLTIVLLVVSWSYKKDLSSWAEERIAAEKSLMEQKSAVMDERIAFQQAKVDEAIRYNRMLEGMMTRTNETLASTANAMAAHTTALARNTDSTHRLAYAVEKLDGRLEKIEHRE